SNPARGTRRPKATRRASVTGRRSTMERPPDDHLGREIMMIRKHHLIALALLGLYVPLLTSCAPPASGVQSYAPVAAPAPGTARVWFVRTKDPQEQFGDPIISAN